MISGGWKMLKHFLRVVLALGVLVWTAVAQTSVNSNTNASATSNTSVAADKSGANVQSNTSANASQDQSVSHKDQDKRANSQRQAQARSASSTSGSTSANLNSPNSELNSGAVLHTALVKSVDARKSKEGDEVVARVTEDVKADGQVIVKKNSKLIGHITQVKARGKGEGNTESSLGIVFDKAIMKDGREVPMHAVIQAVGAAQSTASLSAAEDMSAMGSTTTRQTAGASGGLMGGAGSTVNSTVGGMGSTVGSTANAGLGAAGSTAGNLGSSASAATQLTSNSRGMVGLSGMNLVSEASNSTQGSLITSTSKNVRLDSGTQMLLRITH
jgi:hypothetical protein